MYSHMSAFLLHVYCTHVQTLKVRLLWNFAAVEAGSCRTTCCCTLSASCLQLASHVHLLLEAALTSAMRGMWQGRLTILYTHRAWFSIIHIVVVALAEKVILTSTRTHAHTHTRKRDAIRDVSRTLPQQVLDRLTQTSCS